MNKNVGLCLVLLSFVKIMAMDHKNKIEKNVFIQKNEQTKEVTVRKVVKKYNNTKNSKSSVTQKYLFCENNNGIRIIPTDTVEIWADLIGDTWIDVLLNDEKECLNIEVYQGNTAWHMSGMYNGNVVEREVNEELAHKRNKQKEKFCPLRQRRLDFFTNLSTSYLESFVEYVQWIKKNHKEFEDVGLAEVLRSCIQNNEYGSYFVKEKEYKEILALVEKQAISWYMGQEQE